MSTSARDRSADQEPPSIPEERALIDAGPGDTRLGDLRRSVGLTP
ncbi:MAG: hypothetical protein R2752_20900 [Vicinamibacterales bacterium]